MADIGATLREARMRQRLDVSEIEAKTKIRAKYLRALENEEWDLLPGPTYVKSFLRTYAEALGLDARLVVEEYRLNFERPDEVDLPAISPASRRAAARQERGRGGGGMRDFRRGSRRGWMIAVLVVALIAILIVIGSSGSGGNKTPTTSGVAGGVRHRPHHRGTHATTGVLTTPAVPARASLQLLPTGPVYVCLESATGSKLLDAVTLQPGKPTSVFHSKFFRVTLGNGNLTMRVNGQRVGVPSTSVPLNYIVTAQGRRTLPVAQQPTCP